MLRSLKKRDSYFRKSSAFALSTEQKLDKAVPPLSAAFNSFLSEIPNKRSAVVERAPIVTVIFTLLHILLNVFK